MTARGTPIRSANDPPVTPPPSSEELETPPNPNPNPSDGVTEEEPVVPEDEATRLRRYSGILEATLREQNATIQRLNETRTAPPAPVAAPPARDPAAERQEFYNDPIETTRRTVRAELEETVKPLLDFVKEMKGQGVSGRLKAQVKADPRFSGMWDDAVDRSVDEALARVAPDQINEGTVRAAAVQAIGLKAMGFLENSAPPAAPPSNGNGNPPPAGERRVPASPPHMRPSAPPAPNRPTAPKLRDLTENEERLRRENKMTKEDFLWWLEQPAGDVTKGTPPSQRGRA